MIIRTARGADAPGIWQAHSTAIRHSSAGYYSAAIIDAWAGSLSPSAYHPVIQAGKILVAVEDGRVVGFGQLDTQTGEIEALYVLPAAQGRGVGSALVGALEQAARSAGAGALHLASSLNAVSFYEAAGFHRTREGSVRLRAGAEVPCVFMEKRLAGPNRGGRAAGP